MTPSPMTYHQPEPTEDTESTQPTTPGASKVSGPTIQVPQMAQVLWRAISKTRLPTNILGMRTLKELGIHCMTINE